MAQKTNAARPQGDILVAPPEISRGSLLAARAQLGWASFKANLALFAENRIGLVGVAIIVIFALGAVSYPILINTVWDKNLYDPIIGIDESLIEFPSAPDARHILGTDPLGRDVLAQLLYSTSSEFVLGIIAASVTVVLATTVGAVSAYFGGMIDLFFMRLADIMIMMPYITILIVLSSMLEMTMTVLALVIGVLSGFGAAAVVIKSQALTVTVRAYIEAARVAGGSDSHIILAHILPNLLPISFLYMMFTVTTAIFSEAVLSFFGLLNIRMSWGLMIHTTNQAGYLLKLDKWWLIYPASIAITMLCAAFYMVGRALDEVVNPRLRRR